MWPILLLTSNSLIKYKRVIIGLILFIYIKWILQTSYFYMANLTHWKILKFIQNKKIDAFSYLILKYFIYFSFNKNL